jgi:hypothetical protein
MAEYYTKRNLRDRGWNSTQIKPLLGPPDATGDAGEGVTIHLYDKDRCLAAEAHYGDRIKMRANDPHHTNPHPLSFTRRVGSGTPLQVPPTLAVGPELPHCVGHSDSLTHKG